MAMGFRGPGVLQSLAGMQQPQMPAIMQNLQQPMPMPEPEQKKPGLFGQGGKGWMALGLIGDALQSMDGGRGTYMPAMLDMREQAAREKARLDQIRAQAEAKAQDRVNARNDWVWQQQWQRDNPSPTALMQNDAFLRQQYGEPFARDVLMKPTFVQNWDGTRTQVGGSSAHPSGYDPEEWEIVEGGAGGNVSGNFPR